MVAWGVDKKEGITCILASLGSFARAGLSVKRNVVFLVRRLKIYHSVGPLSRTRVTDQIVPESSMLITS
jgi:hypothetical protein